MHCLSNVPRLFAIEEPRFPLADRAKAAMTRADVTAEHEGCSAIRPTLENVRTACFLANCVQIQPLDQLQDVVLVRRIAQSDLQPLRFWLTGFRNVADYSKFARQGISPGFICKLTDDAHSNIVIKVSPPTVPQSGYGTKPRVAVFHGYPGNGVRKGRQPQRGCDRLAVYRKGHNPVGVMVYRRGFPRVALKHGNPGLCSVTALRYGRS